jgi:hypothetical protein
MWLGIFLICVGIVYILNNTGVLRGDAWDYILAIFFIILGASIIIKRVKRDKKTTISNGIPK